MVGGILVFLAPGKKGDHASFERSTVITSHSWLLLTPHPSGWSGWVLGSPLPARVSKALTRHGDDDRPSVSERGLRSGPDLRSQRPFGPELPSFGPRAPSLRQRRKPYQSTSTAVRNQPTLNCLPLVREVTRGSPEEVQLTVSGSRSESKKTPLDKGVERFGPPHSSEAEPLKAETGRKIRHRCHFSKSDSKGSCVTSTQWMIIVN